MKHLFFDLETMGRISKDCAIIDCSAFVVDTEKMLSSTPYTTRSIVDVKKFKVSIKDQVDNYGSKVYSDTIAFWESLPEAARKNIKPLKTDLTVEEFTDQFIDYLTDSGKIKYWWARSNTFDPIIIWRIFESVKKLHIFNEYLKFWFVRDVRTYVDAKLDFPKKNGFIPIADEEFWNKVFVEHDSAWDVLADVLRMQAIIRAENDLEQIKR